MLQSFVASSASCLVVAMLVASCTSAHEPIDGATEDGAHTFTPGCSEELARTVCWDETGMVEFGWNIVCDDERAPPEIRPLDEIPLCYLTADGVQHVSCREPTTPGVFANDPEYMYCVRTP